MLVKCILSHKEGMPFCLFKHSLLEFGISLFNNNNNNNNNNNELAP
jgi:hypothetical protein